MAVDLLYCNTEHEVNLSVKLDKEDLNYGGDQGGLYYKSKTDGISLDNGSCYPLDILIQDNLNCSQFGLKIYGVKNVKVQKPKAVACDSANAIGIWISFLNGKRILLNELADPFTVVLFFR